MSIKRGEVVNLDVEEAFHQLYSQLQMPDMAGVVFFASAHYAPEDVAAQAQKVFSCPYIGCSTAGEIGSTYQQGGIVGVGFSTKAFRFHTLFVEDLSDFGIEDAVRLELEMPKISTRTFGMPARRLLFSLVDGLSGMEEQFLAAMHGVLENIPVVGGSAGDGLKFSRTSVYSNKGWGSNAAVIAVIDTTQHFQTFQFNHIQASSTDMVITAADSKTRTVYEIDGGRAVDEYCAMTGASSEDIGPEIFSRHPLVLEIGNQSYVRAVQKANDDGSLTFFCAIEEGLPLSLGDSQDIVKALRGEIDKLKSHFKNVSLTLGCDCILRRLEIEANMRQLEVEEILREINFIGFSTYGEHIGAVHISQTMTGVIFGDEYR
ncbi:MAG: FIST N-terminal domain-containing protein [bacterium]|nr:FIST N-terminal domain-containing protein [bacterium]